MFSAWTTLGRVCAYSVNLLTSITEAMLEPHWQTNTPIRGASTFAFGGAFFPVVFLVFFVVAALFVAVFLGMLLLLESHSSHDRFSCFGGAFGFEFFGHVGW